MFHEGYSALQVKLVGGQTPCINVQKDRAPGSHRLTIDSHTLFVHGWRGGVLCFMKDTLHYK